MPCDSWAMGTPIWPATIKDSSLLESIMSDAPWGSRHGLAASSVRLLLGRLKAMQKAETLHHDEQVRHLERKIQDSLVVLRLPLLLDSMSQMFLWIGEVSAPRNSGLLGLVTERCASLLGPRGLSPRIWSRSVDVLRTLWKSRLSW